MSDGLNRVMLIGNLAADGELRYTQGGQSVLNLRLACNERYKDRTDTWKDRCEFVSVVLWGKRAEALSKILSKGSMLYVDGSLRTSSYEDKDGNKRYKTEVNANNVILCGGKGDGGGRQQKPRAQSDPGQRGPQDVPPEDEFGDDTPF